MEELLTAGGLLSSLLGTHVAGNERLIGRRAHPLVVVFPIADRSQHLRPARPQWRHLRLQYPSTGSSKQLINMCCGELGGMPVCRHKDCGTQRAHPLPKQRPSKDEGDVHAISSHEELHGILHNQTSCTAHRSCFQESKVGLLDDYEMMRGSLAPGA